MNQISHRPGDAPKDSGIEHLARGLVLRRGENGPQVLLCASVKRDYTYLPGGHVEFGEPAHEALRREMFEETGLDCRVGCLCLVMEERFEQKGRARHEYTMVFHVEHLEGEVAAAGDPTRRPPIAVPSAEAKLTFLWAPLDELEGHDLRPARLIEWLRGADVDDVTWLPST